MNSLKTLRYLQQAFLVPRAGSSSSNSSHRQQRSLTMGAGSKAGQGALVEQVMTRSSQPLIDIGVNLVDDCFDKVRRQLAAASMCLAWWIHVAAAPRYLE